MPQAASYWAPPSVPLAVQPEKPPSKRQTAGSITSADPRCRTKKCGQVPVVVPQPNWSRRFLKIMHSHLSFQCIAGVWGFRIKRYHARGRVPRPWPHHCRTQIMLKSSLSNVMWLCNYYQQNKIDIHVEGQLALSFKMFFTGVIHVTMEIHRVRLIMGKQSITSDFYV